MEGEKRKLKRLSDKKRLSLLNTPGTLWLMNNRFPHNADLWTSFYSFEADEPDFDGVPGLVGRTTIGVQPGTICIMIKQLNWQKSNGFVLLAPSGEYIWVHEGYFINGRVKSCWLYIKTD